MYSNITRVPCRHLEEKLAVNVLVAVIGLPAVVPRTSAKIACVNMSGPSIPPTRASAPSC